MLKNDIEKALNEQIAKEVFASNSYLSMASWCETEGLSGAQKFFYAQSEEEREHMLKLFHYVNGSGGHGLVPDIKQPINKYDSLHHAVNISIEQEAEVTKSIYEIVALSLSVQDFGTFNFLQWFVAEQQEEEQMFKSIKDILCLAGGKNANLFLVDKEIGRLKSIKE